MNLRVRAAALVMAVTVFSFAVSHAFDTEPPSSPPAATDPGSPEQQDSWMDEGFAALCLTVGYGFAYWDKETKKCIGIDMSSDTVYEVK